MGLFISIILCTLLDGKGICRQPGPAFIYRHFNPTGIRVLINDLRHIAINRDVRFTMRSRRNRPIERCLIIR